MANPATLQTEKYKIKTTERAKELGAKGGQSRSLAKLMINRENCASKCPLWNTCWAKHISFKARDQLIKRDYQNATEKEIKHVKAKCALKDLPTSVIEGATRITTLGEQGFNLEMMEQLIRLRMDLITKDSPQSRERYLYQLREVKKSIYGDKSRFEGKIDSNNTLTADHFAAAFEASKKKKKEESKQNATKS